MEQISASNIVAKSNLGTTKPLFGSALLVFQLADQLAAVSLKDVERITPLAELACPPGLPPALEGFLNLAGYAIPVLRLERLLALSPQRLDLYSLLIILRGPGGARFAIVVDRILRISQVSENTLLSIGPKDSFNGCAEGTMTIENQLIHVLSASRILLKEEQETVAKFQSMAQQRLKQWEGPEA